MCYAAMIYTKALQTDVTLRFDFKCPRRHGLL